MDAALNGSNSMRTSNGRPPRGVADDTPAIRSMRSWTTSSTKSWYSMMGRLLPSFGMIPNQAMVSPNWSVPTRTLGSVTSTG